jgi:hypothetical protein
MCETCDQTFPGQGSNIKTGGTRSLTMSHFTSPEPSNTRTKKTQNAANDGSSNMRSLLSSPLFLSQPPPVVDSTPTKRTNNCGAPNDKDNMEGDDSNRFGGKSLMSSPLFSRNEARGNRIIVPARSQTDGSPIVVRERQTTGSEHDDLLRNVSSWIQDLTEVHETLQRTSVGREYRFATILLLFGMSLTLSHD